MPRPRARRDTSKECIVLAVDPGGTTGWVRVHYWHDSVDPGYYLKKWGTFDDLGDEISVSQMMYGDADVVVTESYIIRPDTFSANVGASLDAVEVIGRTKLWSRHYEVPIYHQQSPAQAKQQWTDKRLKAHFKHHKLYPSGSPGREGLCRHEVDALRHAMTYIENAYHVALCLDDEEHLI